jgi:hypothetical protein
MIWTAVTSTVSLIVTAAVCAVLSSTGGETTGGEALTMLAVAVVSAIITITVACKEPIR